MAIANNIKWSEFRKYMASNMGGAMGTAGTKSFDIHQSAPWSNAGAGDYRPDMELVTNKKEMETVVKPIFEEYKGRHPFKPTPKALTNGGLLKIEQMKWLERALKYIRNHEKEATPWNYRQIYGIPEDKKPRHGAAPSSSWLQHIKVSGNRIYITFPHGSKRNPSGVYEYQLTSPKKLQEFITNKSMGAVIGRLREQGGSASGWGLKRLTTWDD